jgi:signal transduction histidine kinase
MRALRGLLFLASALFTGSIAFAVLLVGWLTVGLLAITPLAVPAAILFRAAVGALARLESALARSLIGARADGGRYTSGGSGYWRRGLAVAIDRAFWREQAYLLVRLFVGWPLAVALISVLGSSLWFVALPIYYRWVDFHIGSWQADSLQRAVLLVPVGVIGVALTFAVARGIARGWRGLAESLLNDDGPRQDLRLMHSRILRVHAFLTALAITVSLIVWALVGGYFWPGWVIIGTLLALVLHGWIYYVLSRDDWRGHRAIAMHAGITTALAATVVQIWAFAGGGNFWPIWPILAFAILLGAHALYERRRGPLEQRIRVLETTRAGAVDVQETELRRIERDLHDGAQARLVALGMNLGMAEQKLDADPEAARELVAETRVGIEEALRELRDLARGIHPPVLTDRGLEAAISSLAHTSAVPVFVSADVPTRPPAAVETAAYFVAAEAMTNAAKHAGATRIEVRLVREPSLLVVEVSDNGRGGADLSGSGLVGLRRRVEALDGTLTVTSPSGRGTTLRAELPCES